MRDIIREMSLAARQEYVYMLSVETLNDIKDILNFKGGGRLSSRENKILELVDNTLNNKDYFIDQVLAEEREAIIQNCQLKGY